MIARAINLTLQTGSNCESLITSPTNHLKLPNITARRLISQEVCHRRTISQPTVSGNRVLDTSFGKRSLRITVDLPNRRGLSNVLQSCDVGYQVTVVDNETVSSSSKKGFVDVLSWMQANSKQPMSYEEF